MTAGIEQDADLPVAPAHHDDGNAAHGPDDVIACLGNFGVVGEEDPEPVEYPVELQQIDVLADESFAIDGSVRGIDP